MKLHAIILASTLAILSSCSNENTPQSTQSLLSGNDTKLWHLYEVEDENNETALCERDDIWQFSLSGESRTAPTLTIIDNLVDCGGEYAESNIVWRLNNESTKLTLTYAIEGTRVNTQYFIDNISADELSLRTEIEDENGFQTSRVIFHFKSY